ncbi:SRPBCC family protein [Pseudonocardia sp. TRM90224]|uniref:SRPBCC family protein n=1 Tax=Pseudonocardia sp. TRM90224 TaxID=2812678 RepID=UPI001E37B2C0|nr:SRPBCC family protein [Pseudonocardia sp. TRM90224]
MADAKEVVEKVGSPSEAFKDAGTRLVGLLAKHAAQVATDKVADLADRLTDVADNGGSGLGDALGISSKNGDSKNGDSNNGVGGGGIGSAIGSAVGGLAETVKGALGGSGGSGKKLKVTVISEDLDIGLPLRTTYDLWTQFGDFPSFMKKVETVDQESDEKTNWKAQVLWSHRTWEATIVEQVPDSHIVWKSKGAKGHVDGVVSFTELGTNLTRVILVLEYWPKGLFERTGNLWRAQGRRARLEFQHFRRHAMTSAILQQDEIEGWRGEIRDGEVVVTHEEALDEEERAGAEDGDDTAADEADEYADDEYADDENVDDENVDDENVDDDEYAADDAADDEIDDEADEEYADEPDEQDEYDDEDDLVAADSDGRR